VTQFESALCQTLSGRHVRLEPIGEQHVASLFDAAQDDDVWKWLPAQRPRTPGAIRQALLNAGDTKIPFAQVEVASGRAVGVTMYLDVRPADGGVEIGGTWIGKPWWRTSINTEAKLLMLGHAFERCGANRVQLKTDSLNARSQQAIARLGAVREGVLRHHMLRRDGTFRDTVMFSVLAGEWPAVREHLRDRLAAHAA